MVYTLFSAPNYCGHYSNLGAILTISVKYALCRTHSSTSDSSNRPTPNTTSPLATMPSISVCRTCTVFWTKSWNAWPNGWSPRRCRNSKIHKWILRLGYTWSLVTAKRIWRGIRTVRHLIWRRVWSCLKYNISRRVKAIFLNLRRDRMSLNLAITRSDFASVVYLTLIIPIELDWSWFLCDYCSN